MEGLPLTGISSDRRPWIYFAFTAFIILSLSLGVRKVAIDAQLGYEQMGMTSPPFVTTGALMVGPILWVLVVVCAGGGVHFIRRVRRATALSWILGWLLGSLLLFAGTCYFMWAPLLAMTPLSKS